MRQFARGGVYLVPVLALAALHGITDWARGQGTMLDDSVRRRWKEYEEFARGLQGTLREDAAFSNGKTRKQTYHWKQNHEAALASQVSTTLPYETITLQNPAYRAQLRRDPSDPTKVVLSSIDQFTENVRPPTIEPLDLFSSFSPHFAYWNVRLSDLVAQPSFQIKAISKEVVDGTELIRINHRSVMEDPKHKSRYQRQGIIYLDPSRCWCIRQLKETELSYHKGELHRTAEWDIRYETVDHPSGFPLLRRTTTKYQGVYEAGTPRERKADGTIQEDAEWEVNDHVPTSEFTLSAFGLPEPVGVIWKRSTPAYVWVLAGAAGCGGLSLLFRYLAQRKRPPAGPRAAGLAARLSPAFLFLAAGLGGLGGYLALGAPARADPPFTVEQPERDLGEVAVGTHTVTFRITNPAGQPRRILGLEEG